MVQVHINIELKKDQIKVKYYDRRSCSPSNVSYTPDLAQLNQESCVLTFCSGKQSPCSAEQILITSKNFIEYPLLYNILRLVIIIK